MGSSLDADQNQFFDAHDSIVVGSDSSSDPEIGDQGVYNSVQLDVWVQNPGSVQERRSKFFDWLGFNESENSLRDNSECSSDFNSHVDRITSSGGAVLRTSNIEHEFSSSRSSMSSWSEQESEPSTSKVYFECRGGNSGGGRDFIEDELEDDVVLGSIDLLKQTSLLAPQRGDNMRDLNKTDPKNSRGSTEGAKKWWLRKLRSFSCVMEEQQEIDNADSVPRTRIQRVKVRQSGKQSKELSAVYLGQDIKAHEGSILTMKFSPDGQYLASSGVDGVVRVWKVLIDERVNDVDIPDLDPSCVYFTMNHSSELKRLSCMEKEKMGKARSLKKTSDSACVIFPPKVFRLLEEPLHELRGHCGEVLDLSWSSKNFLLSSSVDKTARLWQVGSDHCLRVFPHNNYVTCVQFNPVDDNCFISGSIDGKVRVWEIPQGQVVSWTDIRDIVSAVTYHPDGQGGIVGSMSGCCRFFDISGNQLELEGQICLRSRKKSSCKRITSFQYFTQNPSMVMVTCADSQVRILRGMTIVGKYKGVRNGGSYLSAWFTSDGKHIISVCEDSNVHMWNFANRDNEDLSNARKVSSCEQFQSASSSLAIPWSGLQMSENRENQYQFAPLLFPSASYLSDLKGSHQTWPEENLSLASSHRNLVSSMHRSEFKFLRDCHHSSNGTNAWGLVIVTAGWDGRIKSFHNYGLPRPH